MGRPAIWTHFGMDIYTYKNLPWKQKKKLIREYQGTTKWQGFKRDFMGLISSWYYRINPPPIKRFLDAYNQEVAERFTIKDKYPKAVFTDDKLFR